MDVEAYLTQLERLIAEARPVPLSASVMVNRAEVDEVASAIRANLPEELRQSRWVIKERDELLAQTNRESEQVLADARAERDHMLSETEIVRSAKKEAERIIEEAGAHARNLRLEAEDYVDSKLANFEVVLQKTMRAVEKGRERLRGRLASDELAPEVDDTGEFAAEPAGPGSAPRGSRRSGAFYDHERQASEQA